MAYCTAQDLLDRFGERELIDAADRDQDGVADAAVISAACDDAAAEIDARISRRYAVPTTRAPALLRVLACDIARFRLFATRPHDEARKRYEAALALLDAIAEGEVRLGEDDGAARPGTVRLCTAKSLFTPADQAAFSGRLR